MTVSFAQMFGQTPAHSTQLSPEGGTAVCQRANTNASSPNNCDSVGRVLRGPPYVLKSVERAGEYQKRILQDENALCEYISRLGPPPRENLADGYIDALDPSLTLIPLGDGNFAQIDSDDYWLVRPYRWARNGGGYAMAYTTFGGELLTVLMHRLILLLGVEDERVPDHKDCNTLNNRKANLRLCTQTENLWNSRTPKNNTSGIKGISRYSNGWMASVEANGTRYRKFSINKAVAVEWLRKKREELHGEFARHE